MSNEIETVNGQTMHDENETMNNETDTLQSDWEKIDNVYGHISFESDYNNFSPVYDTGRYEQPYIRGYAATNGLKIMFAGYLMSLILLSAAVMSFVVIGLVAIFGLGAIVSLGAFYVGYYKVGKSVRKCRISFWLDIVNTVMGVGVVTFGIIKLFPLYKGSKYQYV